MIQFFTFNEYGIVFGVYSSFLALGSGINTWITYRIYSWLNIKYALALPLIIAPFVAIPLFILIVFKSTGQMSKSENKNPSEKQELLGPKQENDKFRFSLIKELFALRYKYICLWLLLLGFVIWDGSSQATVNIFVSFVHNMFGLSYEIATVIGLYGYFINIAAYLLAGVITSRIGRKVELLIFADIMGIVGGIIYGWINDYEYGLNVFWAYFGVTSFRISLGFTYPIVWASIPLLVGEKLKGTAYGVSASMRFLVISISYLIVGVLTEEEEGGDKYTIVQIYVVLLMVLSMAIYMVLYYLDVKHNDGVLKKITNIKLGNHEIDDQQQDISLHKLSST